MIYMRNITITTAKSATYLENVGLPSLLFMAGCPAGKPREQTVQKIEQKLASDPCLRQLKALRRTYSFAKRGWKIDPNRIDVDIQQEGFDGLPRGIFIVSPSGSTKIDERERFGAAATYVVSTGDLDIWHCGGTWSGLRHNPRF